MLLTVYYTQQSTPRQKQAPLQLDPIAFTCEPIDLVWASFSENFEKGKQPIWPDHSDKARDSCIDSVVPDRRRQRE